MANERLQDVWDAIEGNPAEAETMKLRAELMRAVERHIKREGWTQKEAAERLGVSQPRVSDLMRGKLNLFSLDTLHTMAGAVGVRMEVRIADAA